MFPKICLHRIITIKLNDRHVGGSTCSLRYNYVTEMDILDIYRDNSQPYVRIAAPMVRYSRLPFRLLVRKYGVDLTHTPMIMADSFLISSKSQDVQFPTCAEDRPVIVQLASKDSCEYATATELLAPYCEGVDLNCGCPQKWAMQSGLGSALLRNPEQIARLIRSARDVIPRWRTGSMKPIHWDKDKQVTSELERVDSPFSVTAKLRIVPVGSRSCGDPATNQVNHTVELIRRLASMGVDWVTLHCRTPQQRTAEAADWDVLRGVMDAGIRHSTSGTLLPIVLNGDVDSLDAANEAYTRTKCHGIMVARGLLTNPRLFALQDNPSEPVKLRALLDRWMFLATEYSIGGDCFKTIHQQSYWIMEHHLDRTRRLMLHGVASFAGLVDWLDNHWTTLGDLPPNPTTVVPAELYKKDKDVKYTV